MIPLGLHRKYGKNKGFLGHKPLQKQLFAVKICNKIFMKHFTKCPATKETSNRSNLARNFNLEGNENDFDFALRLGFETLKLKLVVRHVNTSREQVLQLFLLQGL